MTYYSDFSFEFENTGPDIETLTDEVSINQSIKNILFTIPGEVFFDPLFGSHIQQLLFEKMNPITEILLSNEIQTALDNYEPRITIKDISFEPNYDTLEYSVSIEYVINKLNTLGSVDISLQLQSI